MVDAMRVESIPSLGEEDQAPNMRLICVYEQFSKDSKSRQFFLKSC